MSDLLVGAIIYASLTFLTIMLVLLNKRMTYWRRRGVSHQSPNLIFGNLLGVSGRRSLRNILHEMYIKFKETGETFSGFYWLTEPAVFVLNKELAIDILTKDLKKFSIKTPVTMKFVIKSEEIFKASLKAQKLLKDLLEDYIEKDVDVQLICMHYMEEVCNEIFSAKARTKKCTKNFAHNLKWSYVFQQFYSTTNESPDFFEMHYIYRDMGTTLLCCILYELANDALRQQKLYETILYTLQKTGNKFNYECFNENTCLEKQISAVFYRYLPFSHVILRSLEDFPTNQAGYTIKQGSLVILPTEAMDYDDCFQRNLFTKTAFGDFGSLLIFMAVALILRDYKFNLSPNTPQKLTFKETLPCLTLETAVYLKITKR